MYYRLGRAGKALDRFGVIEFATTIAPGVRDVLLTGKLYETASRNSRNKGARQYDAVVLDAPPTGRIAQFLNVNDELAGLAKMGPIKSQADTVTTLLRSRRTAVHLVTVLEEMPVQETADGVQQLHDAGLPVGGVVVNLVRPQDLDTEARTALLRRTVDPAGVAGELGVARIDDGATLVDGLAGGGPRPRPAARARGRAARARGRDRRRRRTSCRSWPPGSTSPGSTSSPPSCASRGWRDPGRARRPHPPPGRAAGRRHRHRAGARRRRAPRRPRPADHRVLRRRRGRQDHHLGRARAAGRRTRTQGGRAHDRPGPSAGPVDGHRGARQRPAAGAGGRLAGRGRPASTR